MSDPRKWFFTLPLPLTHCGRHNISDSVGLGKRTNGMMIIINSLTIRALKRRAGTNLWLEQAWIITTLACYELHYFHWCWLPATLLRFFDIVLHCSCLQDLRLYSSTALHTYLLLLLFYYVLCHCSDALRLRVLILLFVAVTIILHRKFMYFCSSAIILICTHSFFSPFICAPFIFSHPISHTKTLSTHLFQ